jgi:AcrR family transcriptional regulator
MSQTSPTTSKEGDAEAAATDSSVDAGGSASTRERILDVALDLFIEKGYDGTSLREIAERLHFTKAALYYHFASKEDILMALHMRLHASGKDAIRRLTEEPFSLTLWSSLLDDLLDQMIAQRKIFLLHERNQAAMEKLHGTAHDTEHEDLQERFRAILSNSDISLRDRVRMACSFGALFGGLIMTGDAFDDASSTDLGAMLREAVHDLIDEGASRPEARS